LINLLYTAFVLFVIWLLWFFAIGYIDLSEIDAENSGNDGIFCTILAFTQKPWEMKKKKLNYRLSF